jgi:hypothetical protein
MKKMNFIRMLIAVFALIPTLLYSQTVYTLSSAVTNISGQLSTPGNGRYDFKIVVPPGFRVKTMTYSMTDQANISTSGHFSVNMNEGIFGNGTMSGSIPITHQMPSGTYNGFVVANIAHLDNFSLSITREAVPCTQPSVPTVTTNSPNVCAGNSVSLQISGSLNDATQWSIYSGSCGGTLIGTTNLSSYNVTPPPGQTTYYVRGTGGCATNGACGSVTVSTTPQDDATFNYGSSSYCFGSASPTISGTQGGTFSSTPSGLSINPQTGVIDVTASAPNNYTVTYSTTGSCSDSESQSVTILNDSEAPVANCKDITVMLDSAGNATITPNDIDNGSTDNCGIASMSLSKTNFSCSDGPSASVVLTVTDSSGNTGTCNATVTISDTISPTFTCPGANNGTNLIFPDPDGNGVFNGNDPTQTLISTPSTYGTLGWFIGNPLRCFGNASGDLSGAPTPDGLFNIDPVGNYSTPMTFNSGDMIDNSTGTTGWGVISNLTPGDHIVGFRTILNHYGYMRLTWDGTDITLNEVVVNPVAGAGITVPSGITFETSEDGTTGDCIYKAGTELDPTDILDNCTSPTLVNNINGTNTLAGVDFSVGTTSVTWTLTDAAGNSTSCTYDVEIIDDEVPIALCQDLTVYLDASGNASITASDVDNGSSDNCGIDSLSISQNSFSCANIGGNTVELTVTDINGNTANCNATITVIDTINPVASCRDITVTLDSTGNATITPSDIVNGSTDNCGIASLSLSKTNFSCSDGPTASVTLTVTDVNGNSSLCTANVQVLDTIRPTVVCQDITIYLNESGQANIEVSDINNGSTDICGIDSMWLSNNSFDCSSTGVNNIILSASDNAGNTASCTAVVTVLDSLNPIISIVNTSVEDTAELNGRYEILDYSSNITISDNCMIDTLIQTPAIGDSVNIGPNIIHFQVVDKAGNSITDSIILHVLPAFICPEDISYCDAYSGYNAYSWNQKVEMGDLINNSGIAGPGPGYTDYKNIEDKEINTFQNATVSFTLTPGFSSWASVQGWRIFVDWNQNGDFSDAGEMMFSDISKDPRSGSFAVPPGTDPGCYAVRVINAWGLLANSCGAFSFGEVEDYLMNVEFSNAQPKIASKPVLLENFREVNFEFAMTNNLIQQGENIFVALKSRYEGEANFMVSDVLGRPVTSVIIHHQEGIQEMEINTSELPKGIYFISHPKLYTALKVIVQ